MEPIAEPAVVRKTPPPRPAPIQLDDVAVHRTEVPPDVPVPVPAKVLSQAELATRIGSIPLFADLSLAQIRRLAAAAQFDRITRNQPVMRAGEATDGVYALVSGSVRLIHKASDRREFVVKVIRAPALLGEVEVLCKLTQRVFSVVAQKPSDLVMVPAEDFLDIVREEPHVATMLLGQICSSLSLVGMLNRALALNDLPVRMANHLAHLVTMYGQHSSRGILIRVPFTMENLANTVGAVRRSVVRVIARWREGGILERVSGFWVIRDPEALIAMADPVHLALAASIHHSRNTDSR